MAGIVQESDPRDEDTIDGFFPAEEVWGVVQCYGCDYFGKMEGVIEALDTKYIKFVCPECTAIENVVNPDHLG